MGNFLFITLISLVSVFDIHLVSWYGDKFHGRTTASGDVYNMNDFTCAATNAYKFGDSLKVTNVNNQKSVVVIVNDRGNFKQFNRTLDLSKAAFNKIANLNRGVIKVKIERL